MQIDKTSFNDISIFHSEEEFSIFHKLNFTKTKGGQERLRKIFFDPHNSLDKIIGTQKIIQTLITHADEWPSDISNGTILVIEKFLDYQLDGGKENSSFIGNFFYRIIQREDYSMLKYSIPHFADFLRGLKKIIALLHHLSLPKAIQIYIDRIDGILKHQALHLLAAKPEAAYISIKEARYFAHYLRDDNKANILTLIDIYSRLDAWYSLAIAMKKFDLNFPEFVESDQPIVDAKGLYHILLPKPIPYDLEMSPGHNFVFLTGANMAGKSTLIKSVGAAVFLAHLGMGVPAKAMKLTLFDGLLSNINVVDNIAKGESFFFNEVQRIKNTIEKINTGKKWLVLIDELFKGTNVQDAMKCSLAVIRGLIKIKNSLFILSTHLYEIADELKDYPNISFRFFETTVDDEQLSFSYQLKNGVSNDRIGYVILKREKVVDLLENL